MDEFRAALKLKSTDHNFYLALAKAYFKLGDLERTRANIKLALASAPNEAWKVRYQEKLDWLAKQSSHS